MKTWMLKIKLDFWRRFNAIVKMNEHKQDEHEDIEKKLDIFHILNGILAKTRIIIV